MRIATDDTVNALNAARETCGSYRRILTAAGVPPEEHDRLAALFSRIRSGKPVGVKSENEARRILGRPEYTNHKRNARAESRRRVVAAVASLAANHPDWRQRQFWQSRLETLNG